MKVLRRILNDGVRNTGLEGKLFMLGGKSGVITEMVELGSDKSHSCWSVKQVEPKEVHRGYNHLFSKGCIPSGFLVSLPKRLEIKPPIKGESLAYQKEREGTRFYFHEHMLYQFPGIPCINVDWQGRKNAIQRNEKGDYEIITIDETDDEPEET